MIILRKSMPRTVHQLGPLPPQRLGQQEAPLAGQVQRRRVKLHVLHRRQRGPGPEGHGKPGPPSAGGVGSVRVQVSETARGEQRGGCADSLQAVLGRVGVVHKDVGADALGLAAGGRGVGVVRVMGGAGGCCWW